MKLIIVIVLLFGIAALALMLRSSGPRVTTIEHRRGEHDRPKDGDDA